MAWGFTDRLSPEATVYDCMDELSNFAGAPQQLRERETQLLAAADVVFTGGVSLYESKRNLHANVHAFPSSIDADHFAQAKEVETVSQEPAGVSGYPPIRDQGSTVCWMSVSITCCWQKWRGLRPDVHFVMIGPVVKIDPALLPTAKNIHYLGAKAYEELPFSPGRRGTLRFFSLP